MAASGTSIVDELGPRESFALLSELTSSALVDVRTRAEWAFVGTDLGDAEIEAWEPRQGAAFAAEERADVRTRGARDPVAVGRIDPDLREAVVMIGQVRGDSGADLAEIRPALHALSRAARLAERGEQHTDQDRDHRDDNEQFDERECAGVVRCAVHHSTVAARARAVATKCTKTNTAPRGRGGEW